tara:strand:+ start:328 stop:885 length:558 start_codon:yes stop_codon:yes gene_type:complete
MNIKVIKTKISDIKIFQPSIHNDDRGYFFESFNENIYKKHLPSINFVQDNESMSSYGVLRGLHYQVKPYDQAKLIRVIKGEIQDVAIDLRRNSKTYLDHVSINISSTNKKQIYIPKGFAHGFLVLSDQAIINYKVDKYYSKDHEKGLRFNDPFFNIKWDLDHTEIILSKKDRNHNFFNNNIEEAI